MVENGLEYFTIKILFYWTVISNYQVVTITRSQEQSMYYRLIFELNKFGI